MNLPRNRLVGLVLIAAGAVVGWMGWEERQTLGSQLNKLVSGSPSDKAMWLMIIGGVLIVVGALLALRKSRR